MKMNRKNALFIGLGLLIIDRAIKWWVTNNPQINLRFFGNFLNDGFILGYGKSFDLFFWASLLIILILALIVIKATDKENLALVIMFCGAFSNMFDRLIYGGVIDYFKINLSGTLHFNLADCYLIFGIFLYLFILGRQNEQKTSYKIFRNK